MFSIARKPICPDEQRASMENLAAGALVIFEGRVRDINDGLEVSSLEYEAWDALCRREGNRILEEAKDRFGVLDICCVHRAGHLELGECAVWLGVLSGHRGEGFDACRFVIDKVKHRLPIWKRENYVDGESTWVRCEACSAEKVCSDNKR
jgi:molybdopterin synthase catalytic subunit